MTENRVIENRCIIVVSVCTRKIWSFLLTRRNGEVVNFTRSRVKNNSKLTNLMKISRIEGYNGK